MARPAPVVIDVRQLDAALDDFVAAWSVDDIEPIIRDQLRDADDALHKALAPNRMDDHPNHDGRRDR